MNVFNLGKSICKDVVRCDLCEKNNFSLIKDFESREWDPVKRYYLKNREIAGSFLKIPKKFRLLRCDNCGLAFVDPRLEDDVVRRFYREYFSGKYNGYINDYDPSFRENIYRKYFEIIKNFLPNIIEPRSKFLDVGCASGEFMKIALEEKFLPLGIDLESGLSRKAREYGEVFFGDVLEAIQRIKDEDLNLVAMIDSIEHFSSPFNVLKKIAQKIKKGGLIFIETPNLENGSDVMSRHFYLFSPKTIKLILKECGFEVVLLEKSSGKYNPSDEQSKDRFLVVVAKKRGGKNSLAP